MDTRENSLEKWVVSIAVGAFLVLAIAFAVSLIAVRNWQEEWWRAVAALGCCVIAGVWYAIGPGNQGRMIRTYVPLLRTPVTPEDIALLQRTVGSAGFFNRIGLTGLPLAVALLACLLYALAFAAEALKFSDITGTCLELAKLTTGAFIGALSTSRRAVSGAATKRISTVSEDSR